MTATVTASLWDSGGATVGGVPVASTQILVRSPAFISSSVNTTPPE